MTQVTLKGNPCNLAGKLVQVGDKVDGSLVLTKKDLSDVALESYKDQVVVLSLFPSVDTGVCALSVSTFNARFNEVPGVKVVNVSADLPFALGRFCGAEGLDNVETLSCFRNHKFAESFGVLIADGPLKGLCSRVVMVLDKDFTVRHVELTSEISSHVDYDKVAEVVESLLK